MSAPTHPSKSAAQKPKTTRSRNGCWTCRSRKKKCDETRPECTQCLSKGLKCEGYEARLKWGNGVASRGYLKGMNCPIMVMGPGDVENRNGPQRKGGGGVFRESHGSSDSEVSAEVGKGSGDARNEGGEGGGDGLAQSATTAGAAAALLGAFDRELFRECRIFLPAISRLFVCFSVNG
ncbi:hypothetical protein PRK78_000169 [Emydomyces testavorans]|uniref:Zn(2)-C6 fungal-type domain-containing protein n=1 Tax=Emydomyces testavorans TaxID=2070801 RepID=A0AAF0DA63_9EURO|nr:hypothetical protein PRK78_000169 [Emydomyces testavorans]